jgi:hypothetical protein
MKILIILLLLLPVAVTGQNYSLDIKLKSGDVIFYPDKEFQIKQVTQGFGYSFMDEISAQKKQGNSFFLTMWIDFTDTTTFRYYSKNGKFYIYQIQDKGFGKNSITQDLENCRPIFDKASGSIIFPEGTFLKYKVKYAGYELTGTIDSYQANSIYFVVFSTRTELQNLNKTVSI